MMNENRAKELLKWLSGQINRLEFLVGAELRTDSEYLEINWLIKSFDHWHKTSLRAMGAGDEARSAYGDMLMEEIAWFPRDIGELRRNPFGTILNKEFWDMVKKNPDSPKEKI